MEFDIVNAHDVHAGIWIHNVKTQHFTHLLIHSYTYEDCNDLTNATSGVKCWETYQILLCFLWPKMFTTMVTKASNGQYIEPTKSVWMHPSLLFLYGKFWYIHPTYGYFFQVFCTHFLSLPCIWHPNILGTLFLYTINLFSTIRVEDQVSEPHKMGKNKLNHTWKVEIIFRKISYKETEHFTWM